MLSHYLLAPTYCIYNITSQCCHTLSLLSPTRASSPFPSPLTPHSGSQMRFQTTTVSTTRTMWGCGVVIHLHIHTSEVLHIPSYISYIPYISYQYIPLQVRYLPTTSPQVPPTLLRSSYKVCLHIHNTHYITRTYSNLPFQSLHFNDPYHPTSPFHPTMLRS